MYVKILLGILLPFLGTSVGAICVFFFKEKFASKFKKNICGFASGVMIAAAVWSLLIPSMEYESTSVLGKFAFLPGTVGLWGGILFLYFTQKIAENINESALLSKAKLSFGDSMMLFFSVTLHNLPEGMAVGVVYAALMSSPSVEAYGGALALSLGIAMQNIPEGAIISMPLNADGKKKSKAFFLGVVSGVVEPIGAILTLVLISIVLPILPFLLGFAAGAMLYAVLNELIPEIASGDSTDVWSFCAGFSVMMALDVLLG
jgi:ZIP family zinc transporter